MVDEVFKRKEVENVPFNMSLATLERLSELLKEIKDASISIATGFDKKDKPISKVDALDHKLTLSRQLLVNASPLLKLELTEELTKAIYSLDLHYEKHKPEHKHQKVYYQHVYSKDLDFKIDYFIMKLEDILRYHFTQAPNDPRNAVRR